MQAIVFPPYKNCDKPQLSETQKKILELKKKRNAVILAHNYVCDEIQQIADYVGDSLGLSREAKKTSADVIAFAGVDFMAETAKILNPDKTVVLPDHAAGCSLESFAPRRTGGFQKRTPRRNSHIVYKLQRRRKGIERHNLHKRKRARYSKANSARTGNNFLPRPASRLMDNRKDGTQYDSLERLLLGAYAI